MTQANETKQSRTGAKIERMPLARLTTLGVGGEAETWRVENYEQLQEAMSAPYRILGGGSNLVISDAGLPERVIRLAGMFAQTDLEPDPELSAQLNTQLSHSRTDSNDSDHSDDSQEIVTGWIGGGVPLAGLIRKLRNKGLSNLEGTVGIPAQVGGAVWMNAGTSLGEMFDGLHTIEIMTPEEIKHVTPADLDWGYRRSGIPRNHVVTRVRLRLRQSTPEAVRAKMEQGDQKRKGQPKMKTPGCAFKNPSGVSAGKLIDEAGLKGVQIGQAMIAHEHANFIVNLGAARTADVLALLALIKTKINVPLELEYELWPADLQADAGAAPIVPTPTDKTPEDHTHNVHSTQDTTQEDIQRDTES